MAGKELSPEEAVRRFSNRMRKTVGDTHNKRNLNKYGKLAAKQILTRTRKGRGVAETNTVGGKTVKLKKLSSKYQDYRKRTKKNMHSEAKVKKSNLTYTGQLLDSLKVTKVNAKKGSFRIEPTGRRKDGKTNKKVAEYVDKNGRPFLGLTSADQLNINKLFKQTLTDSIRKRLTK